MQTYAPENSVQSQLFIHFGLRENPFGGTPDPRFLFHSETHREALASLINGIDCEFGFQVLVAQPGMGKTTLLFNFLERFRAAAHTAFLFQPQLEPHELLQSLLFELGAGSEDTSVRKLSEQLNQLLGRAAQEHKRVIVVVDEAQNLDFKVLETLRQLSNFETTQAKLMHIVLAGQPQLVKNLAAPEQEQLRQRISSIGRLTPLTLNETRAYINHRLRTAGYRGNELFTLGAVRNIWENGKGVPRNINTLCFNAMLLGFAGNTKSIDDTILAEAARDLDMPSVLADVYRTEPSWVVSHRDGSAIGNGKVQPIRETKPPEIEDAKLLQLAATQGSLAQKTGIQFAAPSGNGSGIGRDENIPPALIEAIVRISQTLEEQKAMLAARPVPSSQLLPATAPAATLGAIAGASGKNLPGLGQATTLPVQGTNAAGSNRSGSAGMEKGSPRKPEKNIPVEQKLAKNVVPPQPQKIGVQAGVRPESPILGSYHPGAKKPSAGAAFWPKALALAALTGVLIFVVFERSPSQQAAQASDREVGQPASEQRDSSLRYGAPKGSQASTMDAPGRPSKAGATTSLTSRDSGSHESDDVTTRKFPAESVVTPGASTGAQDSNNIFFEQDSAVIARQYRLTLQQIADALAKDPEAIAILEGHTDDSGPETYNLDLSSRRAITVRAALINEFNVAGTQLTAIGSGSAAPVKPNSSAAGRAYNRRVAVRFVRLGE